MATPVRGWRVKVDFKRYTGLFGVLLVLAVLAGGYAWWFVSTHHKVQLPPSYSPVQKALQNRYHASQLLLGDNAKTLTSLGDKGGAIKEILAQDTAQAKQSTLIIYQLSNANQTDLEPLIQWIERGGQLIVGSQAVLGDGDDDQYTSHQNPLLTKLGISHHVLTESGDFGQFVEHHVPVRGDDGSVFVVRTARKGYLDVSKFVKKYPAATLINHNLLTKQGDDFVFANGNLPLTAPQQKSLLDVANANKDHKPFDSSRAFVDIGLGQGRLVVLTNSAIFANPQKSFGDDDDASYDFWQYLTNHNMPSIHGYYDNLAGANNAHLLTTLTQGRFVYLLPQIDSTGLFALMWRHLPQTVLGLILTLVLALLALPKPFGVSRSYKTDSSYNIFGFFAHVGQYLWHQDQAAALVASNRQILLEKIIAKEALSDTSSANVITCVAKKTGLSNVIIKDALYQTWQTQDDLVRISQNFVRVSKFYQ